MYVPLSEEGELGPHLTQRGWAEVYLHTNWHLNPFSGFATIDTGGR